MHTTVKLETKTVPLFYARDSGELLTGTCLPAVIVAGGGLTPSIVGTVMSMRSRRRKKAPLATHQRMHEH